MTNYNDQRSIIAYLSISFSILSSICSIINLILIYILRRRQKGNGYLAILWYMGICQLIYDALFYNCWISNQNEIIWISIENYGGLGNALWANILSFILYYIIVYRQPFNIMEHFWKLGLIANIPSLLFVIIQIIFWNVNKIGIAVSNAYYAIRLATILFNFVLFFISRREIMRMSTKSASDSAPIDMKYDDSASNLALRVIANRMMFYPIMQSICRLGAAIYEPVYGYDTFQPTDSNNQFIMACIFSILTPSAGIGYLAIFLIMQPHALDILRGKSISSPSEQNDSSKLAESSHTNTKLSLTHDVRLKNYNDLNETDLIRLIAERESVDSINSGYGMEFDSRISTVSIVSNLRSTIQADYRADELM